MVGSVTVTNIEVEVEVEPDGVARLVVRWEADGDGEVDIATGSTPVASEHHHELRALAGDRSACLAVPPAGAVRSYVSVTPAAGGAALIGAERRVGFEGMVNFRDLGGYRAGPGKRVRWGRVFRSDALSQLTALDRGAFASLGCRVVYDLRGANERRDEPDPMDSRWVEIGPGPPPGHRPDPRTLRDARDGERWLAAEYRWRLDHAAPAIGSVLTGLAALDDVPAVFHCAGGKDRTGLVAALLLEWLGVDRETVLGDYVLSARWRTVATERPLLLALQARGMTGAAAAAFLGAPRGVMAEALTHIDDAYGGIASYLAGPAGVSRASLDALRADLLE